MFKPFVVKLNNKPIDLSKFKNDIVFSSLICQPLISNGFHYFIHRTKDAMDITNKLESKEKFYLIVSPFEHRTPNHDNDLTKITKKYLDMKGEPKILSRAFYKMWEIMHYFDIGREKDLTYAALAEGPGAFIQAVLKYREKFKIGSKNDKFFGVTIHPENGNYIKMGQQFLSHYEEKNPGMIKIHKTYKKATAVKYKSRDNGDITDVKTIGLFKKDIKKSKKYADLVTADGGFEWENENYQEQEAFQLVFGEIIAALRVQNKNGSFVLKLFETFTDVTIKMIAIAASFYNEAYIYKPFFSRTSNSERYLILKGFKYDQKKDKSFLNQNIELLEDILSKMNSNQYTVDIFSNLNIDQTFKNQIKYCNIEIANKQQILINKIVVYIKENNYFGKKYHKYHEDQISAVNWWIDTFFPSDYKKSLKEAQDELAKYINYNGKEESNFSKLLIK